MALSEHKHRFINWLLTPPAERDPKTQTALAEELGVQKSRLAEWKRDEEFLREWNAQYLRWLSNPSDKMSIIHTLKQTATDPDDPKHVQAAKAFFEIEGSLRPSRGAVDVTVSTKPSDLSDEDLRRLMAAKANDELAKRREAS
jgi:hypothetical protein